MNAFEQTWSLTRGRFDDAVKGLSQEQLNWRMQKDVLTLGEMALHVAGVEISFVSQLTGEPLEPFTQRVAKAATDGVVNESAFPFAVEELTPEVVAEALSRARQTVADVFANPSKIPEGRQIKSALGPIIDAPGAFARLAYHPGYHQG
ncbi:MAG TPA: DinB family protein, partial [Fimbriimonas sp.]